jgi:hypothetical protein
MTDKLTTLHALNVKDGDVVEFDLDRRTGKHTIGRPYKVSDLNALASIWRIVSRAADTPTTWADNEGWGDWTIAEEWDVTNNDVQFECVGGIHKVRTRPRIKLEPKRETVNLYGGGRASMVWINDQVRGDDLDTHRVTYDTIDGEPDCSTVRMERLT